MGSGRRRNAEATLRKSSVHKFPSQPANLVIGTRYHISHKRAINSYLSTSYGKLMKKDLSKKKNNVVFEK